MAFIQISHLTCTPSSIHSGDSIKLIYDISGNDQADLTVTYSLDPSNNIFFKSNNGKTLSEQFKLNNPPMHIEKTVGIIKQPPAPGGSDFDHFDITVKVSDGNTDDDKDCTIDIS